VTTRRHRAKSVRICMTSSGYPASLLVPRLYEADPRLRPQTRSLRVVDESGKTIYSPRTYSVSTLPEQSDTAGPVTPHSSTKSRAASKLLLALGAARPGSVV